MGLFRFRGGGFSGIPGGGSFIKLPKLLRPLGPPDRGGFREPLGLLGPSGLPGSLF